MTQLINKKYPMKLEVLTPLSIGVGAEGDYVQGADYVTKDKQIHILNLRKIVECGIDMEKYANCVELRDEKGTLTLIGNKLDEVTEKTFTLPTSSPTPIKAMVKNGFSGRPLIPGSSLKGALRSHVFHYLYDKSDPKTQNEKALLGDMGKGEDVMRFVKVSDFEFAATEIVNTKIFNLCKDTANEWQGGWKHGGSNTTPQFRPQGFNTLYEALPPRATSCGTIMLSEDGFNMLYNDPAHKLERPEQRDLLNLQDLFRIINQQTREYLEKERDFFDTYSQAEGTDDIINAIDELLTLIPQDGNSCVLKMAAGAGCHSITGDWQDISEDYAETPLGRKGNPNARPKSRKIALAGSHGKTLMGFVRLTLATEAEADAAREAWQQGIDQSTQAALAQAEEKEKKRKAKIQAEEERKKRQRAKELRGQADAAFDSQDYEEAEGIYQKILELLPGDADIIKCIEACEQSKKKLQADKLREQADAALDRKDYAEALPLYKESLSLYEKIGDEMYAAPIRLRVMEIEITPNPASETIEEFVARLTIASLPAFANQCKKRGNFIMNDVAPLTAKISPVIRALPKGQQKNWADFKKWESAGLPAILGEDVAKELFKKVNN